MKLLKQQLTELLAMERATLFFSRYTLLTEDQLRVTKKFN